MPTNITQTERPDGGIVLRVSGEMLLDDAVLIERIVRDARDGRDTPVVIDLADLDFLDSESAAVLRVLGGEPGIRSRASRSFCKASSTTSKNASPPDISGKRDYILSNENCRDCGVPRRHAFRKRRRRN